jgi:3-dehydroquinate synthase
MAADFSVRLGLLRKDDAVRIRALLSRAGLPVEPPCIGAARFLDLMQVDKKNIYGKVRLVLLQGIGQSIVTDDFPPDALAAFLCEVVHESAS